MRFLPLQVGIRCTKAPPPGQWRPGYRRVPFVPVIRYVECRDGSGCVERRDGSRCVERRLDMGCRLAVRLGRWLRRFFVRLESAGARS